VHEEEEASNDAMSTHNCPGNIPQHDGDLFRIAELSPCKFKPARMRMEDLRKKADSEIVQSSMSNFRDARLDMKQLGFPRHLRILLVPSRYLLHMFGIVQWAPGKLSKVYRIFVMLLLFVVAVHAHTRAASDVNKNLPTACYALCGLLSMASLHLNNFQGKLSNLTFQSRALNFEREWQIMSMKLFWVVIAIGVCMITVESVALLDPVCQVPQYEEPDAISQLIALVFHSIIIGCMVALTFCNLHVCSGLYFGTDAFCSQYSNDQNLRRMSLQWNVLQATHHESVNRLETCFLLQGTCTLAAVLWTTLDAIRSEGSLLRSHIGEERCVAIFCGQTLLPIMLLILIIWGAGMVSEKCSKVPSFVNAWTLEDGGFKHDSQALVQYIKQSEPGFHVKGARVTCLTGVKLVYGLGVMMFTVAQATLRK